MIEGLINQYKDEMGWNDQSIISILTDYINHVEGADHLCMPFSEYIEQRAEEEQLAGRDSG